MSTNYSISKDQKYFNKIVKLYTNKNYTIIQKNNNEVIMELNQPDNDKYDIYNRIIIGHYKYIDNQGNYNDKCYLLYYFHYYCMNPIFNTKLLDFYYDMIYNRTTDYYIKENNYDKLIIKDNMKDMYKMLLNN